MRFAIGFLKVMWGGAAVMAALFILSNYYERAQSRGRAEGYAAAVDSVRAAAPMGWTAMDGPLSDTLRAIYYGRNGRISSHMWVRVR